MATRRQLQTLPHLCADAARLVTDLERETDRGVALLAVAFLDDVLDLLLRASFVDDAGVTGACEFHVPHDQGPARGAVDSGTVVTVTATPTAGHRFAGWTGDTVTTDSVLVITVTRNWSLTAQFTFTAPFSTTAAASELLGVPSLSVAQKNILDQDGNNNGTYDLGDFLAWVTVSGQGVPPELMARLLAAADTPKGVTP